MPDSQKPDLTAYIAMLKHEITEHLEKRALIECERIDNYGRSLLAFLSDHADKEIERINNVR